MTCPYCGLVTDSPCGFLNTSLGCTRVYYGGRTMSYEKGYQDGMRDGHGDAPQIRTVIAALKDLEPFVQPEDA